MLIKQADDPSAQIEHLRHITTRATGKAADNAKRELRNREAGIRGERESAYLIDFHYARSPNWAVLHDLRLEHDGRVAQIDHLLINRWLDVYVLESKHFHAGVKITEDGEFLRWNDFGKKYEGMPSPLLQNERHVAVLADAFRTLDMPTRMGLRIAPTFHPLVLVSPKARIDRAPGFDSSRVIKADQLKERIDHDIDRASGNLFSMLGGAAKIVAKATLEDLARQLAGLHRPLQDTDSASSAAVLVADPATSPGRIEPVFGTPPEEDRTTAPTSPQTTADTEGEPSGAANPAADMAPRCKQCGMGNGTILHGQYGYYFKCGACNANTAIRLACQPGHKPRLRKSGNEFFRECAQCGDSRLFHANAAAAATPRKQAAS